MRLRSSCSAGRIETKSCIIPCHIFPYNVKIIFKHVYFRQPLVTFLALFVVTRLTHSVTGAGVALTVSCVGNNTYAFVSRS